MSKIVLEKVLKSANPIINLPRSFFQAVRSFASKLAFIISRTLSFSKQRSNKKLLFLVVNLENGE